MNEDVAAAMEVSRRRLLVNATANYGYLAVNMMGTMFLQAFIVRSVGKYDYALWPLVATCFAVLELLPIGIGQGAGRFLAHALGRHDLDEVEKITSSLFFAMSAATLLYGVAGLIIAYYFESIFDIPAGAEGLGPILMLLTTLRGMVAMPFFVFNGGLIATQRYVAVNILQTAVLAIRVGLTVGLFMAGYVSLITVVWIEVGLASLQGVGTFLLARRLVPWQRVRFNSFHWATLRRIGGFSGLTLIITVAGMLYWKTDNIIINKLLQPELLTGYAVVASFVIGIYTLVSTGAGVLMPAATVLHSKGDIDRMARMVYRANRILVPIVVPGLVFLILFGRNLLIAYVGPQYADFSTCMAVLAAGLIPCCTQATSTPIPQAFGRLRLVTCLSVLWAVLNVLLSIYFIIWWHLGLLGVALGTCIANIIAGAFATPIYISWFLQRYFWSHYWNSVVLPLVHCLPITGTMWILYKTGWGIGWSELVGVVVVSELLVHVPYVIWIGLDRQDRRLLVNLLKKPLISSSSRA